MGQCANTQITKCAGEQITLADLFQAVNGTATITGFKRATYSSPGVINNLDCNNLSNSVTDIPSNSGGQTTWTSTSTTITVAANTFNQNTSATPGLNNFDLIVCGSDGDGVIGPCSLNVTVLDPNQSPCGAVGGACLNLTVNSGDTITPSMVQSGATSFGSPVVAGQGAGVNFTGDSSASVTVTNSGSTASTITLKMADGTTCVVTINPTVTANPLVCSTSSITVTPGQILSAASFVSGGTPAYSVSSATGILTASGGAAQVSSAATTSSEQVTVTDGAGASITCNVTLVVNPVTGPTCIVPSDSNVSVSPTSAAAGSLITITANINTSTGGLSGYYLKAKDASGNVIGFPDFVPNSGNQWSFTLPAQGACQNGTYTICVVPPTGTACPEWNNAAAYQVTGCDDTVSCTTTANGATMTGATDPGSTQTVVLPTDQCNCAGYEVRLIDVTAYPADGSWPSMGAITMINSYTGTWQIPSNAPSSALYQVKPQCCKV